MALRDVRQVPVRRLHPVREVPAAGLRKAHGGLLNGSAVFANWKSAFSLLTFVKNKGKMVLAL